MSDTENKNQNGLAIPRKIRFAVVSVTPSYINVEQDDAKIKEDIEELLEDEDNVNFHEMKDTHDGFVCAVAENVGDDGPIDATKVFIGETFYQIIHIPMSNVEKPSDKKVNKLGSQLTNGIYTDHPVMVVKYKVKSDTEIQFDNLTQTDLRVIMEDKFFHTGVVFREDGSMMKYTYQQNMLDNIMRKYGIKFVLENFQTDELELGNMILKVGYNKNVENINKSMSKIIGDTVNGDVYCILYYKPDHQQLASYISINEDHLRKIMKILSNTEFDSSEYHTNITQENAEEVSQKDTSQIVISPYTIIDRMFQKYKTNKPKVKSEPESEKKIAF